jgi:hypothetical protein
MEITQAYAVAVGGVLSVHFLIAILPFLMPYIGKIYLWVLKYFVYLQFLRRHQFLGPWTLTDIFIQLAYIVINVFCFSFRLSGFRLHVSSISDAGLGAGNLSLINMIPLFLGPHLSFMAGLFGVSLNTYRRVHRSAGLMSFVLLLFHVLTVVGVKTAFPLSDSANLYGLIVRIHNLCRLDVHI